MGSKKKILIIQKVHEKGMELKKICEEKLKKVVDKINRVYYNDSKSNNVHVYDYIRNLQINE